LLAAAAAVVAVSAAIVLLALLLLLLLLQPHTAEIHAFLAPAVRAHRWQESPSCPKHLHRRPLLLPRLLLMPLLCLTLPGLLYLPLKQYASPSALLG
jgi:hypothetical protein